MIELIAALCLSAGLSLLPGLIGAALSQRRRERRLAMLRHPSARFRAARQDSTGIDWNRN